MNIWGIPDWLETEVRSRDKKCIYCGVDMVQMVPRGTPRKAVGTWEHIVNDARIITRENIALCCCACNASKGKKTLVAWLQSTYCKQRGVNEDSVAQIVKDALRCARKTPNENFTSALRPGFREAGRQGCKQSVDHCDRIPSCSQ